MRKETLQNSDLCIIKSGPFVDPGVGDCGSHVGTGEVLYCSLLHGAPHSRKTANHQGIKKYRITQDCVTPYHICVTPYPKLFP